MVVVVRGGNVVVVVDGPVVVGGSVVVGAVACVAVNPFPTVALAVLTGGDFFVVGFVAIKAMKPTKKMAGMTKLNFLYQGRVLEGGRGGGVGGGGGGNAGGGGSVNAGGGGTGDGGRAALRKCGCDWGGYHLLSSPRHQSSPR